MAFDARDKEIALDSHVRYVDTGTIGKVIDIKTQDGSDWVKIDKTNSWYRSKLVELLDEKDLKKRYGKNTWEKKTERRKKKQKTQKKPQEKKLPPKKNLTCQP